MRKFLKNQKGVTMVEVLITVAILAIVVVPCLSSFVMAQRGNVKAAEITQAYTSAANLMEQLKGGADNGEILEGDTPYYDPEGNITLFSTQMTYGEEANAKTYYSVSIYAGEQTAETISGLEPILKGVIALD